MPPGACVEMSGFLSYPKGYFNPWVECQSFHEPVVAQASSLPVPGASCPAVMVGRRDVAHTGRLEACATKVWFMVPMHA